MSDCGPNGRHGGSATEVFGAFLRLGLTSLGGPAAHLGYFRAEFVERRRWLDEPAYADVVGLCQFLPGPASSQTGFALGVMRAGWTGGLAAWAGFTLPSAALLVVFASGAASLSASRAGAGLLQGLKLVAVAIVAQAVWSMARTLCPDRPRAGIATAAAILVLLAPTAIGQVAAIALGSIAGLWFRPPAPGLDAGLPPAPLILPVGRRLCTACLVLFTVLLLAPPVLGGLHPGVAALAAFYRSGALVFGGGHVVLPLLRDAVVAPGWVSDSTFLAGYGAVQAVPGPLFTFAAYLGMAGSGPLGGVAMAALALVAIFLPGLLLLIGVLPFWAALRSRPRAQSAMRGTNAAVVGLLGAALYDPIWVGAVHRPSDFALALLGFVLLAVWRTAPLLVATLGAVAGLALTLLG